MRTDKRGLYLHIPFCLKKCNYCDFCSFALSSVDWRERYVDRLCEEIMTYEGQNIDIDSIFIGGGTPSLLNVAELERIVMCIRKCFDVSKDCEFTIEANPKTLDEEKLSSFVSLGVNRLSIGLQSIHENEMKILGRVHNFDDFLESYRLARKCGIDNINVDLMYGIPEQTMDSFRKTVERIIDLSPEHVSLYGLILEEGTPFYEMKDKLALPKEDSECDMYYLATRMLADAGYTHYEISNYAKAGFESRHNLKYWRCEEYIGIGLAAYSYFDGRRFGNTDNVEEYFSSDFAKYDTTGSLDISDEAYEFVMLGLRLKEGFSLSKYKDMFGEDFIVGREEILNNFIKAGYMEIIDGRLSLTESGFYVSNSIINELI